MGLALHIYKVGLATRIFRILIRDFIECCRKNGKKEELHIE
jgi:hypothetical protein